MLKWFCSAAALSLVMTAIIPKAAFSRPTSSDYQYPEVPKSDVDIPVCYIQTSEGRTLNLQKLCNETSPGTNSSSPGNNSSSFGSNSSSQGFPGVPSFRRGSGNSYASDTR